MVDAACVVPRAGFRRTLGSVTLLPLAVLLACTQPGAGVGAHGLDALGADTAVDTDTAADSDTEADTATAADTDSEDSGCRDAPVADAGPDQTAALGAVVELEGAGRSGCGPYQFQWTLQAKPSRSTTATIDLSDASAANPTFTAYDSGPYVWSLAVYDGARWSVPDTVTVTVTD